MKWLVSGAAALFFVSGAQAQECVTPADWAVVLQDSGKGRVVEIVDVPASAFAAFIFYTFDGVIRINRVNADGCLIPGAVALAPAKPEANA